jgi:hypothetical protein
MFLGSKRHGTKVGALSDNPKAGDLLISVADRFWIPHFERNPAGEHSLHPHFLENDGNRSVRSAERPTELGTGGKPPQTNMVNSDAIDALSIEGLLGCSQNHS